jgi:hypothetical protein
VPSARRNTQLAVLVLGGTLAAGSLAGCATTQEKAAAQRAESARILKAREKRQERKRRQAKHGKENR